MTRHSNKVSIQRTKAMTKIIILVIVPLCLILLPAYTFDNGHYTICLLKLATGNDCWGCGLSRACMHLIHLDFDKASSYNSMSFVVLPILIGLYATLIRKQYRKYKLLTASAELTNRMDESGSGIAFHEGDDADSTSAV